MATLAQIILIIACACLVECRFIHGKLFKRRISLDDHHYTNNAKINLNDPDAVIFPNDDTEANVDLFKKTSEFIGGHDNNLGVNIKNNDDTTVKYVPLPLTSKVVPEIDVKDVFTNPAALENTENITDKTINNEEANFNLKPDKHFKTSAVVDNLVENDNSNTILASVEGSNPTDSKNEILENDNPDAIIAEAKESETKLNVTVGNMNESVPDFSSRFGVSGSYMLVPVATNVQNYQPIQANSNMIPISSAQGNLLPQTHVPMNRVSANAVNFQAVAIVPNSGANAQFVAPHANTVPNVGSNAYQAMSSVNVAPTVAANVQYVPRYANIAPNVGANVYQNTPNANVGSNIQYAVPNNVNYNLANAPQGNSNTYVPVNVPNTYVINGQLYVAVTVPNNVNVPSSLYYVNPQVSYQVNNNVPLYKLVSVNDGVSNQVVNTNKQ